MSLPGYRPGESLEVFMDREIRTPEIYKSRMREAVDGVVRHFHQLPGESIKEIVLSGSLGKGTTVGRSADADLVIFFNGYDNMERLISDKPRLLESIERHMGSLSGYSVKSSKNDGEFFVCFELSHHKSGETIYMDVLPAMDIISMRGGYDEVNREMGTKSVDVRAHYSTCFCKIQKEMVVSQPAKVKDLIRFLKYWKQANDLSSLKSYCCEQLVLHHYQDQNNFRLIDGFKNIIKNSINEETIHLRISVRLYHTTREWFTVFPDPHDMREIRRCARGTLQLLGSPL